MVCACWGELGLDKDGSGVCAVGTKATDILMSPPASFPSAAQAVFIVPTGQEGQPGSGGRGGGSGV